MRIGIHPDNMWGTSYSEKWAEFLTAKGVEVKTLNLLESDVLLQLAKCSGVMCRYFHIQQDKQSLQRILYTIEHYLEIPVFPNSRTAWHYDEKVAQSYLLDAIRAPQPLNWIFWDRDRALSWADAACFPVVFKLSVGAGASNVIKIEARDEALKFIEMMFGPGIFPMTMNEYRSDPSIRSLEQMKTLLWRTMHAFKYALLSVYPPLPDTWWKPEHGYALFQEFLPGNSFDTRVTIIGNRAFAFRRMNRPGDFRASGSGIIDYDHCKIDQRCLEIAFETSRSGGFQTMAYDFLYKNESPVICEISYTFVDTGVYSCPGHWDSDLNWHKGQMWPEEAQVIDFMNRITASHGS
jgi:glutathione synthase/RimK-type ligase-like ATP-grasp enzyme